MSRWGDIRCRNRAHRLHHGCSHASSRVIRSLGSTSRRPRMRAEEGEVDERCLRRPFLFNLQRAFSPRRFQGSSSKISPVRYIENSGLFSVGSSHGVSGRHCQFRSTHGDHADSLPTSIVNRITPTPQASVGSAWYGLWLFSYDFRQYSTSKGK